MSADSLSQSAGQWHGGNLREDAADWFAPGFSGRPLTWERLALRADPLKLGVGWNVREAQQRRKAEEELNRQRLAQLKAQQAAEAAAKKTAETGGQRMGWGASLANIFVPRSSARSQSSITGFNTSNRGGNLFGN